MNPIAEQLVNNLRVNNPREDEHSRRVSELAVSIGQAMELSNESQEQLKIVGLLHDIGKMAIDQGILNKSGQLTPQEWDDMKRHPQIGYSMLNSSPEVDELREYVLAHHEKWDGSGYPRGLVGEGIPRAARIIAIADAYDAMTSERVYKSALSQEQSITEIRDRAGTQFDPCIAKIFVERVLCRDWLA